MWSYLEEEAKAGTSDKTNPCDEWKLENVTAAVLERTSSPWGAWELRARETPRRTVVAPPAPRAQCCSLRSLRSLKTPSVSLENTRSSAVVPGARKSHVYYLPDRTSSSG